MKQKNKRISRNKTNSIKSNKAENNVGNDVKKGSSAKSSCDFKRLLCIGRRLKKKFMESKNMSEERKEEKDFLHKALDNLLNFHPLLLSGISLVSMICYFVYFGIFIGYFPVLSGSDIFYIGALLFTIVAILSLFIVSIILLYGWYYIRANNQPTFSNNWLAMILAIPLTLILVKYLNKVISIFLKEQYDIFNNKLLFFIFFFFISFCLFSLLLKIPNWLKNLFIKFPLLLKIRNLLKNLFIKFPLLLKIPNWLKNSFIKNLIYIIFSFIKNLIYIILIISVITGLICLVEFIIKTNGWVQLCLVSLLYMCILVLIFLFTKYIYKDKKPATYVSIVTVMLFIVIFNYCSDDIAKKFEITNIEYKYLSIEKSALGALPENICKGGKYCDDGKTYYDENESNGVVKLYNIKVLSTLGKFYYLEAIGCENNEKIRFELDANKIISRQK